MTVRLLNSCPGTAAALPAVLCSACKLLAPGIPVEELSQSAAFPAAAAAALLVVWLP
jgi:hypothetical protein